jgi:hypothetical protein
VLKKLSAQIVGKTTGSWEPDNSSREARRSFSESVSDLVSRVVFLAHR